MSTPAYTLLTVKNNTPDAVEVYVTFAAQNPSNTCCPAPVGLQAFAFLTKVNNLMGRFTLDANSTQEFDSKGQCFSGNICFHIEAQCPLQQADFNHGKYGTSLAEFTLNPAAQCAEAFDISCVNGINSYLQIKAHGGPGWTYGPNNTPISSIANRGLQQNAGNPGVYPVNCTNCTGLVGPAPCDCLPVGPPQTEAICNVQRYGQGGVVQVVLNPPPTPADPS